MNRCKNLQCVSLHISKLKHLEWVGFACCEALTRVDLSGGYPSEVEIEADHIVIISEEASSVLHEVHMNFKDCVNLDPETIILHQESIILKNFLLSGEEVPSCFTHCTTGNSSLTVHVPLSQPSLGLGLFKVCVVLANLYGGVNIKVHCEFRSRFGNSFDDFHHRVWNHYSVRGEDRHNILAILDCSIIPRNKGDALLAQRNYEHVDMKVHITATPYPSNDTILELKGWGLRLFTECSSPENCIYNPHVCELDEDNNIVKVVKSLEEIRSDCGLSERPLMKPMLCPASNPGHAESSTSDLDHAENPASDPGHEESRRCLPSWRDLFSFILERICGTNAS